MECITGKPFPFGATIEKEGINFAIYGKDIQTFELHLFKEEDLKNPLQVISLNRTGDVWHVCVKDAPLPLVYGYKVFKQEKTYFPVLDPYAKQISSDPNWHDESRTEFSYDPMGKVSEESFDWEGVLPPKIAKKDLIIYEMHVRGFTRHSSSQVSHPGTFLGMIEKIPYLKELGVNAVEILPIQEFCEEDVLHTNPETGKKLHNYFGYSTVNFFSVMNRYGSHTAGSALNEFKTLVRELHKNGIEVILDIVFNHTFEGNENGPVRSFKALDGNAYYIINEQVCHMNFSGCGNTFNCNHPITRELIIDVLRYYVLECHVDGFRFDLAAVFFRGKNGGPLETPPLLEAISADPILSSVKLIAEPWDPGGLYQLGTFASFDLRWSEWDGKYQTVIRNFIKGVAHQKQSFAGAICGYQEIYPNSPYASVNYITCHDGFCLKDLVSYNEKHNLVNGENNQDGSNNNESWNCGHEGETSSKKVQNLRKKQMRNFFLALMVSQGIPMIMMGDEIGLTKFGNNNPWCQDNELNWMLWEKKDEGLFNFCKFLIHLRKTTPLLQWETRFTDQQIHWHGLSPEEPKWDEEQHFVAFSLHNPSGDPVLYAAFNTSHIYQTLKLPSCENDKSWHIVVATQSNPPNDFFEEANTPSLESETFRIAPYSSLLLLSKPSQAQQTVEGKAT